ncbi:hypothetical protein KCU65_g2858, partial [Aureobasidium melanogenum]
MHHGFTSNDHLTNTARMNGFTNFQCPYDSRSSGFQMNCTSMNHPYVSQPSVNATQMNGLHFQTSQMHLSGQQMDRLHLSGQQMNPHQMTASMPVHLEIPTQAGPGFVNNVPAELCSIISHSRILSQLTMDLHDTLWKAVLFTERHATRDFCGHASDVESDCVS